MEKRRKFSTVIIIIILGIGLIYVGYRFHKIYKNIEFAKEKFGYKSAYNCLPNKVVRKGQWQRILLDADIAYTDGAHNIIPYDLDNDGKDELIANSYRSDTLMFYKCEGNPLNPLNWSRYIIDSSVGGGIPKKPLVEFIKSTLKEKVLGEFTSGAHYTAIADMNGDGRIDIVVAGDLKRYDIIIYEAPKIITKLSKWKKHIVYKNDSHRTYHVETGDIDCDGNQDIVFATKTDNSIGFLKNNRSSSEWPLICVDNNCIRCFNARVADIDKDGQNDIIASEDDSSNGGKLHFYSYINNPMLQENWSDRTIANFPLGHGVSIFEIVDIDNDGDLDIVTGNHQGDVYILENTYPNNVYREWNKYKVNKYNINSCHNFREIDVGDIDSDGDLDIIASDQSRNMVMWFENSGIIFENWKEHVIDKSDKYLNWCHSVALGDIDCDGDLDIAVAAAASNVFLWYNNELKK